MRGMAQDGKGRGTDERSGKGKFRHRFVVLSNSSNNDHNNYYSVFLALLGIMAFNTGKMAEAFEKWIYHKILRVS